MTTQREGFLGDIVEKVKDLLTDDDVRKDEKPVDPPLTPQCCGGHPVPPVYDSGDVLFMHESTCKNYKAPAEQ